MQRATVWAELKQSEGERMTMEAERIDQPTKRSRQQRSQMGPAGRSRRQFRDPRLDDRS